MARRRPYRPRGPRRSPPPPPSGSDIAAFIVIGIMLVAALIAAAIFGGHGRTGCRTGVLCGGACIHATYTCHL